MFGLVSKNTHDKTLKECERLARMVRSLEGERYESLLRNRKLMEEIELDNRLIARLNRLVDSLKDKASESSGQFTQSELRSLILLCHPDRHNGKESAITLTQKLISMRTKNGK